MNESIVYLTKHIDVLVIDMSRQETVERFRGRLLEVIQRAGMSRSAFASKVGIDRSTLSQILSPATNRLPRVDTLAAIAASEHVSIDWLIGLSEEGGLRADILPQTVELQPGGQSVSDEHLAAWRAEAMGYKIRYVPTSVPDLVKTPEVIEFEYRSAAVATPEQRHESSQAVLDYQRRPETDTEVCSPVQNLRALALGQGLWQGLPSRARRQQIQLMIDRVDELYPRFRWFMYDELHRYSVPMTIFGPKRAAIYLGQMFLVLNSREHITVLTEHFDDLIRAAVIQPSGVGEVLQELLESI
jgi:transcriptional regulator with XRE-family HTH domain